MGFQLTPQAQAINEWVLNGTGSLQVTARAGCGKTTALMSVTDIIIAEGLGDIAILAYNKSIAEELKDRLAAKGYEWKRAQAGTVHSFGFAAWRKGNPDVVVDDKKITKIIDAYADELPDEPTVWNQQGATVAKLVGYGKQAAIGHLHNIDDTTEWTRLFDHFDLENDLTEDWTAAHIIKAAIKVFRQSLDDARKVIDFDDMILVPLVYKTRFWTKKWIMVDESQDTNPARRALAMAMLTPRIGRMIFVGDPCQAIYGFTGADSNAMDLLREATNAQELPLTVTYRCPKAIVAEANKLVPDIVAHASAPAGIVRNIEYTGLDHEKLAPADVILCRNTAPLVELAFSLITKGTACRIEGRAIGEGLVKLAKRWKLSGLAALMTRLSEYQEKQMARFLAKKQEEKIQPLVDQIDCLRILIQRCQSQSKHSIADLVGEIQSMFGDTKEGEKAKVLTLSTIHKSKGREWHRVYILGRREFLPSPYARKEWQQVQESNLEYVAITRAQSELITVAMPPKQKA